MPSLSSKRLYLRGVPKNTTCEDLDKYLSCYGEITEVKVLPSKPPTPEESLNLKRQKHQDALAVLETFRNQPFLGKHIVIEFAHPLRKDMALATTNDRVPKVCSTAPQSPPMRFTVLVSDIPKGVRWQELKDFGRLSGNLVAFCDIDRYGNGFIEYFTREDAKRAVTALNGKYLGGRRVHVEEHQLNSGARTRHRIRSRSPLRRSTSDRSRDNDQPSYFKDEGRPSVDGWFLPFNHTYDYPGGRSRFFPSNTRDYMRSHFGRESYVNSEITESWAGSSQEYRRGEHDFRDRQYTYEGAYDDERSGYRWSDDSREQALNSMDPYL